MLLEGSIGSAGRALSPSELKANAVDAEAGGGRKRPLESDGGEHAKKRLGRRWGFFDASPEKELPDAGVTLA